MADRDSAPADFQIIVVASVARGVWRECVVTVPQGATVADALAASSQQGLTLWPGAACGVWGRVVGLDWVLRAGDRVEMYRPLTVDPKTARRQRFARQGVRATGLFSRQRPGGKAGY
ncbi:MAG: RnfH family protein [Burkholderiaceae bacterium]|nr:RnfH family protein [Burkholderiaceae bacterium]